MSTRTRPVRRPPSRPALDTLEDRSLFATHLILSGITAATAGVAQTVTVTAANADGSTDAGYGGTIHFTSNDPRAVLPANTTLTNGVGTFPVTFLTAGRDTLTATDTANGTISGGLSAGGSSTAYTQPGDGSGGDKSAWYPPDGLDGDQYVWEAFTANATQPITEIDWKGHYTNFLSGAGQSPVFDFTVAIWPNSPYVGVHEPNIVGTPLVHYQVGGNAGETQIGTVGSVPVYGYQFTLPTAFNAQAGTTYWVQIEAWQGVTPFYYWPPDWTWGAGNGGDGTHFREIIGGSLAGGNAYQQVSGDMAFALITPGNLLGVPVNPAATSKFVVSGLSSPVTAGTAGPLTVIAQDPFGNLTPAYNGTVHFTSTDPQAGLPADYAFQPSDQGTHPFSIALKTVGTQSVTATDTLDGTVSGSQSNLTVTPAAAATLSVWGFPSPAMAGTAQPFTVTAYDPYGNVATGYAGPIHFTSSDAAAGLPADYAFAAGDLGQRSFTATLNTVGTWSLSARDTVTSSILGTQSGIQVTPAVTLGDLSFARWTTGKAGFSAVIPVTGGDGAYTLVGVTGLPAGLRADLAGSAVTLGGTPTGPGSYPVTITVRDGTGGTVSRVYSFTVDPASTLSWTGLGADNKWTDAANWSGAAPTAGATLVFGPGALQKASVNDFPAGTRFRQIVLRDGGFVITGNTVRLTSGIDAAGTGPAGATIGLDLTLTASQSVTVAGLADVLELTGAIRGAGFGITKSGAGTLIFAGTPANGYTGATTVTGGVLRLDRPAITVAGPLDVRGGRVVYGVSGNQLADRAAVSVGTGAALDLNGQSDTIGRLTLTGGAVATGAGTLTLGGNLASNPSPFEATITGHLDLGGVTRTVAVADGPAAEDLTIAADVSHGGITKPGTGALVLGGTNSYSGTTAVKAGVLDARNDQALGTAAGNTTVSGGATLEIELESGQSFADSLTLGGGATLLMLGGSNAWAGSVTLNGRAVVDVGAGVLTLAGTVRGPGGLTKTGAGTLLVDGTNTFRGPTTVSGGTLGGTGRVGRLTVGAGTLLAPDALSTGNLVLGSTAGFDVTIGGTGLPVAGHVTVTGTVTLGGSMLTIHPTVPTSIGDSFTLIDNDGIDAIVGTFAGLAQGATIDLGGAVFQINYTGGTGNDVILTRVA